MINNNFKIITFKNILFDRSGLSNNHDLHVATHEEASCFFNGSLWNINIRYIDIESFIENSTTDFHIVLRNILSFSLGDRLVWNSCVGSLGSTAWWSEAACEGRAAGWLNYRPIWSSIGLVFAPASSRWAEFWNFSWISWEKTTALIFWCNFLGKNFWLPETI